MKIFGHRGSSRDFGDNNLISITNSYEIKADGVEMDVSITLDEIPIMQHNPIDKISGIPVHERKYQDSDLKFEDVLKLNQDTTYIIDIKDTRLYSNICSIIVELCYKYKCVDRCIFASFNEFRLLDLVDIEKMLKIKIQKAYITGNMLKDFISEKSKTFNLTHLIIYKFQVNGDIIKECHEKNIKVYVYTCNHHGLYNYLEKLGANGIITDCPSDFI